MNVRVCGCGTRPGGFFLFCLSVFFSFFPFLVGFVLWWGGLFLFKSILYYLLNNASSVPWLLSLLQSSFALLSRGGRSSESRNMCRLLFVCLLVCCRCCSEGMGGGGRVGGARTAKCGSSAQFFLPYSFLFLSSIAFFYFLCFFRWCLCRKDGPFWVPILLSDMLLLRVCGRALWSFCRGFDGTFPIPKGGQSEGGGGREGKGRERLPSVAKDTSSLMGGGMCGNGGGYMKE